MEAVFKCEGYTIPFLATANVAAGEVVVQGDIIGVTKCPVANGETGTLALSGIYEMSKGTSESFAIGDFLYWDDTDNIVTKTESTNKFFGVAVAVAATTATVARVLLESRVPTPSNAGATITAQETVTKFTASGSGTASTTLAASTETAPTATDFDNLSTSIATSFNALVDKLVSAGVLTTATE